MKSVSGSKINYAILSVFIVVHLTTLFAMFVTGFRADYLLWTFGIYAFRWLGFTCAVHRYFSHKVCRTSRAFQAVLALWATLTMIRAPIRFSSGHRHHHIHSDTKRDLHSPRQHGYLRAYIGWAVSHDYHEEKLGKVGDLVRYPELIMANQYYFVPNLALLLFLYIVGGAPAAVYGGLLSIVLVWHVAFSVTVLFHTIGKPKYRTFDDSRNSDVMGYLTFGEGWHNNHHANMAGANMGHESHQIDIGYLVLRAFEKLGLVWDLNRTTSPRFYESFDERSVAACERARVGKDRGFQKVAA